MRGFDVTKYYCNHEHNAERNKINSHYGRDGKYSISNVVVPYEACSLCA